MKNTLKKGLAILLAACMVLTTAACSSDSQENSAEEPADAKEKEPAATESADEGPAFVTPEFEHSYVLQEDSHEATDTEGGFRHYICSDCQEEYSYETAPLVYETNPKTGKPVDQSGAYNPLLPTWEHIPDGEPEVFWSREDEEWRVYLYGSHDDTGVGYCGFNYELWSAPVYDLSDWRNEGIILDISEGATSGATVGLFAPDAAYDVTTDRYYMIANEFNAYAVLRVADSPAGPWVENEALWYASTKAAYDPAIYIEDGTIYIAGSCMKNVYGEEEIASVVEADGYSSGMSHIAVIHQLKEDPTDGDGIEATTWLPTDEKEYFPIYEAPSLDYIEELGCYVFTYVSNDYGADGTSYNSSIGYAWTDDIINGTWHYGENGVEETYTDPGMVISGNHGNIISDTSGRYVRNQETGKMEFTDFASYFHGNNHGGIAKINGEWYYCGHRQTNAHAYSRQAVIGKLQIYKDGDTPVIEPMEFTSSGAAESMDAYEIIDANTTVYLLEEIGHPAPAAENNNIHTDCVENTPYILASREEQAVHAVYVANLAGGNVMGFKYLDFGDADANVTTKLLVSQADDFVDGTIDIYLDAPAADNGGTKIGTVQVSAADIAAASETEEGSDGMVWSWISGTMDSPVSGTHAVYFVFQGDGILCNIDQFCFSK